MAASQTSAASTPLASKDLSAAQARTIIDAAMQKAGR